MRTSSRRKTKTPGDPFAPGPVLATPGAWLDYVEPLFSTYDAALGQIATNAHDEALYLILRTLELPLDAQPTVLRRQLTSAQQGKLRDVFRRRLVERVPAAYLTREAWLAGQRFYVDERVIIPRSYFLELIPELGAWLPAEGRDVRRVIDVCTGSGCLAILLARQFRNATVDGCDLSRDALEVARINVAAYRLKSRVQLYQSDVLDAVPADQYDLILSNPPYEPTKLVDGQTPEFAAEPRMAHDGGKDGLEIIRKLVRQAADRLLPHGILVIEVGGLRAAIEREFRRFKPEWLHTQDGSDCVVLFRAADLRR